jgi:NADH-quinone oxidoreductase subunit M
MFEKDALALMMNLMIFAPLAGVPLILLLGKTSAKYIAFVVSLIPFVLSLLLYAGYLDFSTLDATTADGYVIDSGYRWFGSQNADGTWVSSFDINYLTGIDGISVFLVLLTTFIFPISILFSWGSVHDREAAYYNLLLILEVGVLGVFLALDLILFYVFFEMVLIPMYFLIGIWGGKDRIYASLKFFLYTLIGSLLMLVCILYLGYYAGTLVNDGYFTSDLLKISSIEIPAEVQWWLFIGFALSFAIKVPLFPLHTWLPDAHVQAPTAGSVILAAVLLKMGTYGLVRFCLPLFPDASLEFAPIMCLLGTIGIIYGAMASMVQTDIKKLVAYSSVSHLGFIVLGIFSFTEEAMSGAIVQMVNHGISTGALFLIIGMIYDRRHTREIKDFQGIAKVLPIFTVVFMITTFSSIGLPGLNGFVGEFLILLGSFSSDHVSPVYAVLGTTGVIIAAVYMLWMFRRVMFGTLDKDENRSLTDLNARELGLMLPLIALMFYIGFHATPVLKEIGKSSDRVVEKVISRTGSNFSQK